MDEGGQGWLRWCRVVLHGPACRHIEVTNHKAGRLFLSVSQLALGSVIGQLVPGAGSDGHPPLSLSLSLSPPPPSSNLDRVILPHRHCPSRTSTRWYRPRPPFHCSSLRTVEARCCCFCCPQPPPTATPRSFDSLHDPQQDVPCHLTHHICLPPITSRYSPA